SKTGVGNSGEIEVYELRRVVRKRWGEREPEPLHGARLLVHRIESQVVLAGSEEELVHQSGRDVRRDVQSPVTRRALLENSRRQREILARCPANAVGHHLLILVLREPPEDGSLVSEPIVDPDV